MNCSVQEDKVMFPGCSDVVRVGTDRWTSRHDAILDRLFKQIDNFLQTHSHLAFDDLTQEFIENEPSEIDGNKQMVYLMYGNESPFFIDNGELQSDIRGLVYRPAWRRKGGRIVAEFG